MKSKIILLFLITFSYSITKADWTRTNGIYGGQVNKMFSYGDKIFVGTPSSGIYVSDDNGSSYVLRNNGLTDLDVTDFTSEGNRIYAGTRSSGVFRSTNSGLNWIAVNSGLTNLRISSLAVNGSKIFVSNDSGVFRSTNSGVSWISVNNEISGYSFSSITSSLNTIFITGVYSGIFRSTNDGDSWEHVVDLPTGIFQTIVSSDSNIFATGLLTGIRRSTDLGLTWTTLNFVTSIVYSLGVNGDTVFAGIGGSSANLYISTNNGNTWDSSSAGLPRTGYASILSILFNSTDLFVAVPKGVYRSTNTGQNWFNSSANIMASSITTLYNFNNRIYAGSYETGISYTSNNGEIWTAINQNLSSGTVISIGNCDSVLFIGTYGGNYRSTNYGTDWIPSNLGFSSTSRAFISNNSVIMGLGPNKSTDHGMFWFPSGSGFTGSGSSTGAFVQIAGTTYATGGYKIFRSPNFGEFWVEIARDWVASEVMALATDGNYLFAGVSDSGIYLTSSNGSPWIKINNGITNKKIQDLYWRSDRLFAATQGGVFVTSNLGANWQTLNTGLTNLNVRSLESDSTYLYAGTAGSGVWKIPLSDILTEVSNYTNNPVSFYLSQNYPNPFNPNTIINYSIPSNVKGQTSDVRITLYDILGNEVAVLVNQIKNPGSYSINFDGTNLSSGIYFYVLLASSPEGSETFRDTKRMILIK